MWWSKFCKNSKKKRKELWSQNCEKCCLQSSFELIIIKGKKKSWKIIWLNYSYLQVFYLDLKNNRVNFNNFRNCKGRMLLWNTWLFSFIAYYLNLHVHVLQIIFLLEQCWKTKHVLHDRCTYPSPSQARINYKVRSSVVICQPAEWSLLWQMKDCFKLWVSF